MTTLRRIPQLMMIVALGTAAMLVVLELTDAINRRWRRETAASFRRTMFPDQPEWALALLGVGAGVLAMILIAAQLAPEPKGRSRMLNVSDDDDGSTRIAGRAALRAVEHELTQIDGVTAATAVMATPKRVHAVVRADDRCNLEAVIAEGRERLDTPFWINLGLADIAIEITAEFDPRPPRVR